MSLKYLFTYIGYTILIVNVIIYFSNYKNKSITFKLLSLYLCFSLIIQLFTEYLANHKRNNLFLFHYFNIIQFILLSGFFYFFFKTKMLKKVIIYVSFLAFVTLPFIITKSEDYYNSFNVLEIIIFNFPIIVYSFIFLVKKLDSRNKEFIYFNAGLFVYLTCSALLFSGGNLNSETRILLWRFNQFLYIVYQTLILIDWYKNFRGIKNTTAINNTS